MSGADDVAPPGPGLPEAELRAAEYVLGTSGEPERAAMERALAQDPASRARVRAWERRLAPLADAVPAVDPPPRVRAALLQALPGAGSDRTAVLRRQVRLWRLATAGAGLLAAGLALFIAAGGRQATTGRYLAVVQGGGAVPALVVQVDIAAGTARVRPVGAEAPAGRSLQLWYVGAGGPKPLGLVQAAPSRVALPPGTAPDGVLAVSIEPPGGSPSGQPTGPVIYTGKLIAD